MRYNPKVKRQLCGNYAHAKTAAGFAVEIENHVNQLYFEEGECVAEEEDG
jgi:hypothetical protein